MVETGRPRRRSFSGPRWRTGARRRRWRSGARWAAVVAVALLAAGAAMATLGSRQVAIGPVQARLTLAPSLTGGTVVEVPPLGQLSLRTHAGPLQLRARVDGLRVDQAQELFASGARLGTVAQGIEDDVRRALLGLALQATLVAVLAGAAAAGVVFRRVGAAVTGAVSTVVVLLGSAGVAWATLDSRALTEPTFTGLLTRAPALTGGLADVEGRFNAYRERVATLTGSVSRLYATLSGLPDVAPAGDDVAVLWVSDIHNNPEAYTLARTLIEEFDCQGVVDTGDLTDVGSEAENATMAPIATLGVPYVVVRGNHDSLGTTQAYLSGLPNVTVLDDGSTAAIGGVTFAGTGDPRFAPSGLVEADSTGADLTAAGARLAAAIEARDGGAGDGVAQGSGGADGVAQGSGGVDVALVHEPAMAAPLAGVVPLVLDGHTHRRASTVVDGTLELTQGSSGGAGLRTLTSTTPTPLLMSVLHFDPVTHGLLTVDDLTVAGVGESSATLQRRTAASYRGGRGGSDDGSDGSDGSDGDGAVTPSPTLASPAPTLAVPSPTLTSPPSRELPAP